MQISGDATKKPGKHARIAYHPACLFRWVREPRICPRSSVGDLSAITKEELCRRVKNYEKADIASTQNLPRLAPFPRSQGDPTTGRIFSAFSPARRGSADSMDSTSSPAANVPNAKSPISRKRKRGRHAVACESCHRRKQRVS